MKKILLLMAILLSMLVSCSDDKDHPKDPVPNQTLKVGETYTILKEGDWVSENEFIAIVENNVVTAKREGVTSIKNGGQSFFVEVNPTYNPFPQPILKFGSTSDYIKSGLDEVYSNLVESTTTIDDKTFNVLIYEYNKVNIQYWYVFDNNDELIYVYLLASRSAYNWNNVLEWTNQRYVIFDLEEDGFYFLSANKETGGNLDLTTLGNIAVYRWIFVDATDL